MCINIFLSFIYFFCICSGGRLVAQNYEDGCYSSSHCLTGGKVMACFFSTIMGSIALGQLVPPLTAFVNARVAIAKMHTVITREPEIDSLSPEVGSIARDEDIAGEVQFEDITFAYPSRPELLVCKQYSLTIPAGEKEQL